MSLYTKYRPRDWDSVIGQDRIRAILRNSLAHDRVGHAYLFHGSRGTGKTTSARILAKGVNCLDLRDGNPCHTCANCVAFDNGTMLDVIEIDAASNTGVDNIRDLIERARFEPSQGKYKVYIIDEVHMLSTGAFNALLKTLEEPPPHVKFILATTEIDKVPETIRSRALRFDFHKITESDIIDRLNFVIGEEKIQADPEAVKIIAKYARGGLRDALTLLEQNTIDDELSVEHVRMTLSLLDESMIDTVIESLRISDQNSIIDTIAQFRDMHIGVRSFFEQLMYRLRDLMIEHLDDGLYHEYRSIYDILESAYTKIRMIPDGILLIEMTLLKIIKRNETHAMPPTMPQNPVSHAKKITPKKENISESLQVADTIQTTPAKKYLHEDNESQPSHEVQSTPRGKKKFSYISLLDHIKEKKPSLVTDLKTARFEEIDHVLTLIFSKNWNYTRVNTPEMRTIITEILDEAFGGQWSVQCRIDNGGQGALIDDVF